MKILSIVCGGVACYKYIDFARSMIADNTKVSTILTSSACNFITPLLVSSTTNEQCYTNDTYKMEHISLSRDVDAIVIFSATANFISSLACGLGGNLALDCILAKKPATPLIICPSMNPSMWSNPIVKTNVQKLKEVGYIFCGPVNGSTVCDEKGEGKLEDIKTIKNCVLDIIQGYVHNPQVTEVKKIGKTAVVTTGATIEKIDEVRYLTNFSSGLQGVLVANELYKLGFDVHLVAANLGQDIFNKILKEIKIHKVTSADQMLQASLGLLPCNVFVSVAAVCDFKIKNYTNGKIKKDSTNKTINMQFIQNTDILKTIGHLQNTRPNLVVGFAAEEYEKIDEFAIQKLLSKNADIIIANAISINQESVFLNQSQLYAKIIYKHDIANLLSLTQQDRKKEYKSTSKLTLATDIAQKISDYFTYCN